MMLVIGSSGFIGRHLLAKLNADGCPCFEMNSQNEGILNIANFKAFKSKGIKKVIHLGAKTSVPDSWKYPRKYLASIAEGTQNVLDFCLVEKAELLYVSSYVYGQQEELPISETRKPLPGNPYASAKLLAEDLCLYFHKYLGVPVHIVRPFNIYGPGQSEKFLIQKIIKYALSENGPLELENMVTRRDYVFIEDLATLLMDLSKLSGQGKIYNVGSGESYSVQQIVSLVEEKLGRKLDIKNRNEIRPNEILDCVADISLLKKDLGWYPQTSLSEGLGKVLQAFKGNK